MLSIAHHATDDWRLVLQTLADDAARIESLLRLIESLAVARRRARCMFLTGNPAMYSASELKSGIELPAVLFSDLDEATASQLADLFHRHGFDAFAREGLRLSVDDRPRAASASRSFVQFVPLLQSSSVSPPAVFPEASWRGWP